MSHAKQVTQAQVREWYKTARTHHKAGRLDEAQTGYETILRYLPHHAPTIQFLGLIAHQNDSHEQAVGLIEEAIRHDDSNALFYNNYGIALKALGREDEAEAAYRKALELKPDYPGALYNLAMLLFEQENLVQAEAHLRRALEPKPNFIDAIHGLGQVLAAKGEVHAAETTFRRVLDIDEKNAEAYVNLGKLMTQFGRLDEAVEQYRTAIRLDPDNDAAYMYLGNTLQSLGAHTPAKACYKRVLKHKPESPAAWLGLGSILDNENDHANAMAAYRQAMQLSEEYKAKTACHLALLYLKACDWDLHDEREQELTRLIEEHLDNEGFEDLAPLTLNYFGIPVELRRKVAEHRAGLAEKAVEVSRRRCAFTHTKSDPEQLRIGYVSPDFRTHAVGTLIRDLFRHHDRSSFEIFAFSLVPAEDEATKDIRAGVDHYIDISKTSAEVAARKVHDEGIHILIDLAGYTTHSKTELFAMSAAPVQGHYLGYLDTMGAKFLPYMIADSQVVTPEMEASFSEAVIYLPPSFFVTSQMPKGEQKSTRKEVGIPDDVFVFCCMNNQRKINPEVFEAWMRILKRVPESVFWIHDRDGVGAADNLRREAANRGVNPDRLIIAESQAHTDYMARYPLADLFLDTFVYNAGATAIGALRAGVPILTRPGSTMLNRMGASFQVALGLPEMIASDTEEYVNKAVELAGDPKKLGAIREKLRSEEATGTLFDTAGWVRHLEVGFRLMWQDYVEGTGPRSHHVRS